MVNPKLIHITDLHFGDSADSVLAGINPLDSFNAVLDAIDENGFGEELLLLSGDLSGVAHRNSYKMLNRLLKNRNKQVAWLPGNHDRFYLMEKYLDNLLEKFSNFEFALLILSWFLSLKRINLLRSLFNFSYSLSNSK